MQNELTDDVKLRLLAGKPIYISNNIPVYPLTLDEISELGENTFSRCLKILLMEDEDAQKITGINDVTTSQFLYSKCEYGQPIDRLMVLNAFKLFLKSNIDFHDGEFFVGELDIDNQLRINKDNFKELVQALKWQCCIKEEVVEIKKEEFNPADEATRQAIEKLKKSREKLKKAKKNTEDKESLSLSDLVSILSTCGNGLNILNIWQLTLYQFNNQFNRTRMKDKYQLDIKAMLAGAKVDNLENWMEKI